MQSNQETLHNDIEAVAEGITLSRNWQKPQVFSDQLVLGELEIAMLGISAAGVEEGGVSASAVSLHGPPLKRAWFELVERSAILDFFSEMPSEVTVFQLTGGSQVWPVGKVFGEETHTSRLSKSNGVASHTQKPEACASAYRELLERDQVLRTWLGWQEVQTINCEFDSRAELQKLYSLTIVEFYKGAHTTVLGIFGIPQNRSKHPFICGFGAAATLSVAIDKAESELLQRLAFLWGEELPTSIPERAPTALFHQEWSLTPQGMKTIEKWLAGSMPRMPAARDTTPPPIERVFFVDMTPRHLVGKCVVVKAYSPDLLPLYFGEFPKSFGDILPELAIHPIA
jgi:hypothetical protein